MQDSDKLAKWHLDSWLLGLLLLLSLIGLGLLYSATNQDITRVIGQALRLLFAFVFMGIVAQIPPHYLKHLSPWLYGGSLLLLIIVLMLGAISKGAQRWLDIGLFRFQPAECLKLALPLMLAWHFNRAGFPPGWRALVIALGWLLLPTVLTAKQPDLGTALLILFSGLGLIFLSGVSSRALFTLFIFIALSAPLGWHYLHDYQRERIVSFLNPQKDPLGSGYHSIQSNIAIGSGGIWGKGFLKGTQSHLQFLPEHDTDFIFSVCAEELGLFGELILLSLYLMLIFRGFYISFYAQDIFSRLLAGSITLGFFGSIFINIGMVTGMLPVVGVPLPFISYGGTSMMTLWISFGLLMSLRTHRRLIGT